MLKYCSLFLTLIALPTLSACLATSGVYKLTAFDQSNRPVLTNIDFIAEGSGIYNARNAICTFAPKSTIFIYNVQTGIELKGESPYRCQ